MKHIFLSGCLMLTMLTASADSIELWSGEEAANWGKGLSIKTLPAYKKSGPGDVIKVEYDVTAASGSIKLVNYTPWTEFMSKGGLGGEPFEYKMTDEAYALLIPGTITLQGQGVNFRRVSITTDHYVDPGQQPVPDPEARPECRFMDLSTALFYGAGFNTKNNKDIDFDKRGALGWYWSEGMDMSECGRIEVTTTANIAKDMLFQIGYSDNLQDIYNYTMSKDMKSFTIDMKSLTDSKYNGFKKVTSVSIVNNRNDKFTAAGLTIKAYDRNGASWDPSAGVSGIAMDADIVKEEFYNLQGIKVVNPRGIVVVRRTYSDGTVKVEKEVRN